MNLKTRDKYVSPQRTESCARNLHRKDQQGFYRPVTEAPDHGRGNRISALSQCAG